MTTSWNTRQDEDPLVGVRTYADIDLALKGHRGTGGVPQFAAGAEAAYAWAMGRSGRSPVTGTDDAEHIPELSLLTAEVDASVVRLDDPTLEAGTRDFVRGVHDALAWICGYSDQPA
ncbi:hypothetical protein [Streptomyces agglomeratus]|uniref:hypothetical protein n=1 Tax=Streptomyces agglomeratus TaxID=285458 RepID=UPI001F0AA626|nr:hypothetical protein [Streptomyces agglomeratus]